MKETEGEGKEGRCLREGCVEEEEESRVLKGGREERDEVEGQKKRERKVWNGWKNGREGRRILEA